MIVEWFHRKENEVDVNDCTISNYKKGGKCVSANKIAMNLKSIFPAIYISPQICWHATFDATIFYSFYKNKLVWRAIKCLQGIDLKLLWT